MSELNFNANDVPPNLDDITLPQGSTNLPDFQLLPPDQAPALYEELMQPPAQDTPRQSLAEAWAQRTVKAPTHTQPPTQAQPVSAQPQEAPPPPSVVIDFASTFAALTHQRHIQDPHSFHALPVEDKVLLAEFLPSNEPVYWSPYLPTNGNPDQIVVLVWQLVYHIKAVRNSLPTVDKTPVQEVGAWESYYEACRVRKQRIEDATKAWKDAVARKNAVMEELVAEVARLRAELDMVRNTPPVAPPNQAR